MKTKKNTSKKNQIIAEKKLADISEKLGVKVSKVFKNTKSKKAKENEVIQYLTGQEHKSSFKTSKSKDNHTATHTDVPHVNIPHNNAILMKGIIGKSSHTAYHTNTPHTNTPHSNHHSDSPHTNITFHPPQPEIPPSHTNIAHKNSHGNIPEVNNPGKDSYTDINFGK